MESKETSMVNAWVELKDSDTLKPFAEQLKALDVKGITVCNCNATATSVEVVLMLWCGSYFVSYEPIDELDIMGQYGCYPLICLKTEHIKLKVA